MKRRFFATFVFLALTVPLTFAQRSYTPPTPAQVVANKVARLTKLLTLTTTQQAEATTIFTTEQNTLSPVRASLKTARTALQAAVLANNTSGISLQASTIGNLTTQEVEAQSTANAEFYSKLTPMQQAEYTKVAAYGGRGGGGFGPRGRRN
jgi:Spy/CpxP family protein refolding chaperone